MPISIAPRQPKLITREQRCPSAEMLISRNKSKTATASAAAASAAPKKIKRNVQFYEIVSIRSTTHINDMSDEEVANAWFSRREMMTIKRALATEVKYMMCNSNNKDAGETETTTTRGLEFRTKDGSALRRSNKLDSIHAVLDEQDLQHMRGINDDPEGLRKVYTSHSRRCLAASQALGRADQEVMERLQKEEQSSADAEDLLSLKKDNVFVRLFTKKREVMEEIKRMKVASDCAWIYKNGTEI